MSLHIRLLRTLTLVFVTAFGAAHAQTLPALWTNIKTPAAAQYTVTLAPDAAFEGNYGVTVQLTGSVSSKQDFGGLIQASRADAWKGRKLAMRAWIKTENADSAQMWLRIDAVDHMIALDNMDHRAISGTTGWALYEIVMEVPQDAASLLYGIFLVGAGRVDIDNVHFQVAPVGTKVTTVYKTAQLKLKHGQSYTPPRILIDAPANLDFEQSP